MTNDGGAESGESREAIEEKRGSGLAFVSAGLSILAGLVASGLVWWGEPFRFALLGAIYGVVVGFCMFILVICLAFLITLPFAKRWPKVSGAVFALLLIGAPVLAWIVVGMTLDQLI